MVSEPGKASPSVAARLTARVLGPDVPSILVLPSQVRGGTDFYSELDLEAVKIARDEGLDVDYLDGATERAFLGEYSASLWTDFAIGVAGNLTSAGLLQIGRYLRAQLRSRRARGLIGTPDTDRLRVVVQKIQVDAISQKVTLAGVDIEATGSDAVTQVLQQLGTGDQLDQLDAPDAAGDPGPP